MGLWGLQDKFKVSKAFCHSFNSCAPITCTMNIIEFLSCSRAIFYFTVGLVRWFSTLVLIMLAITHYHNQNTTFQTVKICSAYKCTKTYMSKLPIKLKLKELGMPAAGLCR